MIGVLRIKDANGVWQDIPAIRGERGLDGKPGEPGPMGPMGPKGADGTMVFEDLTDEQREMLRGPIGETGPQGPKGDTYIITEEDKIEIGRMVMEGIPMAERVEF